MSLSRSVVAGSLLALIALSAAAAHGDPPSCSDVKHFPGSGVFLPAQAFGYGVYAGQQQATQAPFVYLETNGIEGLQPSAGTCTEGGRTIHYQADERVV